MWAAAAAAAAQSLDALESTDVIAPMQPRASQLCQSNLLRLCFGILRPPDIAESAQYNLQHMFEQLSREARLLWHACLLHAALTCADLAKTGLVHVRFTFDRTPFRRMLRALHDAGHQRRSMQLLPPQIQSSVEGNTAA